LQDPNRERERFPCARLLAYPARRLSVRAPDPSPTRLAAHAGDARADDPIFALNAEATRRREAGEDVVNSTLGALLDDEQRLATLPAVAQAYARIPIERGSGYAPIAGPKAFLEAVQADLFGNEELAHQAVAVATPGGTGALALAVSNFLEPGQSLLTSSYFWSPYQTIAEHAGRGLETFPMFAGDGRFHAQALAQALERTRARQGRALLFLNTPCHNPTGYSLVEEDWRALVPVLAEAARRQPLTVLVDLAYARYGQGDTRAWVRHLAPLVGQLTLLAAWSASKAFTQYGARIGACVALEADAKERERVRAALGASCRGTWSNCNHLGMLAITECLRDPGLAAALERERGALCALLASRVELFTRLAREAGLAHPRYEGGFFVTVFAPDSERTAAHMRARGVFVVPVPGAVRVAICSTPARAIARLVEALAAGLNAV
jgi:aromatic-amino-acid transaminase